MALSDFKFDPEGGWNDASKFPSYPARDQVRPLMQKLFDQIKTWLNGDVKTFVNGIDASLTAHEADDVTDAHGFEHETGTWSPNLGGVNGEINYPNSWYVRTGDIVTICCEVEIVSVDTTDGQYMRVSGIPFTNNARAFGVVAISDHQVFDYREVILRINPSGSRVLQLWFYNKDNGSAGYKTTSTLQGGEWLYLQITYRI
jgi:hypothetical protein